MNGDQKNKSNGTPEEKSDRGLGLDTDVNALLLDPGATKKDIALVRRAVRERWPIPELNRADTVNRMLNIISKETITVPIPTMDGLQMVECEGPADEHAIQAAKVLVSMVGQNQADEFKSDEPVNPINIAVGVNVQQAVGQEPEYLEYVRGRRLANGGNADAVGTNRYTAKVLGPATHSGNGSSSNGHHSGG